MLPRKIFEAFVIALSVALSATGVAAEIIVSDAYARVSRPNAPTGAAFMVISNSGTEGDRLIEARSDIAKRVELHTHIDQGDGIMKMTELENGIDLPAGGSHMLARGGDHVMLMGLTESLTHGGEISVTLVFENAGELEVAIPVDNERTPDHGGQKHSH